MCVCFSWRSFSWNASRLIFSFLRFLHAFGGIGIPFLLGAPLWETEGTRNFPRNWQPSYLKSMSSQVSGVCPKQVEKGFQFHRMHHCMNLQNILEGTSSVLSVLNFDRLPFFADFKICSSFYNCFPFVVNLILFRLKNRTRRGQILGKRLMERKQNPRLIELRRTVMPSYTLL